MPALTGFLVSVSCHGPRGKERIDETTQRMMKARGPDVAVPGLGGDGAEGQPACHKDTIQTNP